MDKKKLIKIQPELDRMRQASVKASEIQGLAKKLGRRLTKRGKEPMWENERFEDLPVLAIPDHGGKDLSPGVKHSVLNQLEDDIQAWDELLSKNGSSNGDAGS